MCTEPSPFRLFKKNILPSLLLVEDDDIDAENFMRSVKKHNIPNPVFIARDGVEAVEMLQGEEGKEKVSGPCVIILDINMPRMNGFELLEFLRGRDMPRRDIVFMLTTSLHPRDIQKAYAFNVSGYFSKDNFYPFFELLQTYLLCNEFPVVNDAN